VIELLVLTMKGTNAGYLNCCEIAENKSEEQADFLFPYSCLQWDLYDQCTYDIGSL